MSAQDSVLIPPPHIAAIAPYQAGKPIEELAREFGLDPAGIPQNVRSQRPWLIWAATLIQLVLI
jgi:histidinol-phosphate aminotransferase